MVKRISRSKDHAEDSAGFRFERRSPIPEFKPAPCQENCPCGTSVRDWIAPIAQRERTGLTRSEAYRQAWLRIVDNNPFPAVMGRICPHPCESQCNRNDKDGAVAVSELERFLGDWAIAEGLALPVLDSEPRAETVGVIGAGPAGLSFAYQMARLGYRVTVYDWHQHAGGMLRYGVPEYRLPRAILDAEIRRITELGVNLQLGVRVGQDLSVAEARARHEHWFLGLGAQLGRHLGIAGETGPGVYVGTDFLARHNTGEPIPIGSRVIVVGGGNTAIDVARVARRRGAEVSILYRRGREDMPAIREEIEAAVYEGARLIEWAVPSAFLRSGSGALHGVTVQRLRQGKIDESGRPRPEPIPDDVYHLEADTVIEAVAQEADKSGLDSFFAEDAMLSGDHDVPDVELGGDVTGAGIASSAIAQGKAAAMRIYARDMGDGLSTAEAGGPTRSAARIKTDFYRALPRVSVNCAPLQLRLSDPDLEISETITEEIFLKEVERCLSCGACIGCQLCWMYCNAGAFTPECSPRPGYYMRFDPAVCEGCGKCLELCPCGFLDLAVE